MRYRVRAGTLISMTGLILGTALSVILKDPLPFTAVGPIAVGGKWWENIQERRDRGQDPA